ncbi:hypothetical protein L8T85_00595 [Campylobacter lari]|nr:hypothetical protein [Campylobacter lari]
MYKNYPGFIIKSDNKFDYKIAFFKRSSKNIEEYLNIKKDGGHELVKIIIYYFNKKYFDFFYNLNKNITPNNPVIILVDNEKAKDKPLETLKKIFHKHIVIILILKKNLGLELEIQIYIY